jgi:hypothetical protein
MPASSTKLKKLNILVVTISKWFKTIYSREFKFNSYKKNYFNYILLSHLQTPIYCGPFLERQMINTKKKRVNSCQKDVKVI